MKTKEIAKLPNCHWCNNQLSFHQDAEDCPGGCHMLHCANCKYLMDFYAVNEGATLAEQRKAITAAIPGPSHCVELEAKYEQVNNIATEAAMLNNRQAMRIADLEAGYVALRCMLIRANWRLRGTPGNSKLKEAIQKLLKRTYKQVSLDREVLMNEPSLGCYDCGVQYGGPLWVETIIPDKVWARISPTRDEGGILCICCIAGRIRALGCETEVPVWICGTEPLSAMEGDPSEKLSLVRSWDIAP